MAIILKANKVDLFVSSVSFVFWYHSPNVLDTSHISCDAHLLNELLDMDVEDNAIEFSAGKLRKLWDSLRELCSYLCER
jgi:hypothetical protein